MTQLDQIILAFNEYKLTHKRVSCPFAPLCIYHDFLRNEGYCRISDWDPNGWEVDFWEDFYNPETKDWVTLDGSLYYGDFSFNYYNNDESGNHYDYDKETIDYMIKYG